MGFFSGTGERLMQIEREEDEEERREKEEDKRCYWVHAPTQMKKMDMDVCVADPNGQKAAKPPQAALASIRIFSLHHVKRVDLDERVVGGDLPNESHDEAEEYAPLSAMQELHPSSCAGAKECYTGLSLPQEKMIPKKAHIEKFDRVNQGSAESTLPDKQITTQELHPIFLREPKRITLVYLCHTWLLRTHALKSLIRPIKAVQNQPKRVTPIMEVQNQLCRIEQITAQELHPSFSSRTKEDYTGSSLPRMVAKVQSRLYRINFAGKD
ncbi:uncharacterized protein [Aegilops tauschii subsp. strangulata]|uniref:uncharacterized protein n=1 Tax=Aegilops tauschii subsp. strangulata TaxID=200361 RepID=UPI003CC8B9C7